MLWILKLILCGLSYVVVVVYLMWLWPILCGCGSLFLCGCGCGCVCGCGCGAAGNAFAGCGCDCGCGCGVDFPTIVILSSNCLRRPDSRISRADPLSNAFARAVTMSCMPSSS